MTPAWFVPTVRATEWQPLAAVATFLAAVSAVAAYDGHWPVGLLGVAGGALAAAVVAGLRDPAGALLAAVPTSAATRRARRLALLVPAGLGVWLAYLGAGQHLVPGLGWPVGPVVALIAGGVAVAAWAPQGSAQTAAGVGVPLIWTAAGRSAGGLGENAAGVLFAWQHHPWLVTVAAVAALLKEGKR